MSQEELSARNELWERAIRERDVAIAEDVLGDGFALVLVHPSPLTAGAMPSSEG